MNVKKLNIGVTGQLDRVAFTPLKLILARFESQRQKPTLGWATLLRFCILEFCKHSAASRS